MKNIAVFISSCDKYSDLWNSFYALFFKYWPDCNLPIYHVSDSLIFQDYRVNSICPSHAGTRYTWSGLNKWALQQIPEDYILLILDDYFIVRTVDFTLLSKYYEIVKQENACYLRLTPNPAPVSSFKHYSTIGILPKSVPWRTSTQIAIWKKEELINLLNENENPWEYERNSIQRADDRNGLYLSLMLDNNSSVLLKNYHKAYYPIIHLNATNMGKWDRETLRFCKRNKIALNIKSREKETWWRGFYKRFYYKYSKFVDHILDFIQHRLIRVYFPNQMF
jgi:hypothetical protein